MLTAPLEGLVVVDLTRVLAGPYATMILADLGAEVIKIEQPGQGDEARGVGPFKNGVSAYFTSINRGKRSVTLDLKKPRGRDILLGLLEGADVLCENFRPGVMGRLGLDYASLAPRFPRLVYAATSGFGQTGPDAGRPAYDLVVQARSGLMSITGEPGGPPVRVGVSISDLSGALFTLVGLFSALEARHRTGRGQMVDVALLDSTVALLENAVLRYDITGESPGPLGTRHPTVTPFEAFATRTAPIVIAVSNDAQWRRFCDASGRDDLAADLRFATNQSRTAHYEALRAELVKTFAAHSAEAWLEMLSRADVPCGPIQTVGEAVEDPQITARGMIAEVLQPRLGRLRMAWTPVRLSETPPVGARPAPDLGEHTEAVLRERLGLSEADLERLWGEGVI